jgi:hypothetical protein
LGNVGDEWREMRDERGRRGEGEKGRMGEGERKVEVGSK